MESEGRRRKVFISGRKTVFKKRNEGTEECVNGNGFNLIRGEKHGNGMNEFQRLTVMPCGKVIQML